MTHFWAKTTLNREPGLSVFDHMINVGCVAQGIAAASPELLGRFKLQAKMVGALAALHDVGKISPGFQRKCVAWLMENDLATIDRNGCWDTVMEPDHGKTSHAAIQVFLSAHEINRKTAKFVSAIIGAHHGRLFPPNDRGYAPPRLISESLTKIDWENERTKNAQAVWDYFDVNNVSLEINDAMPAIWWIAGLTTIADWIGSDERFFSPQRESTCNEAKLHAENALSTIGFVRPRLNENLSFEGIFGFPLNDMQQKTLVAVNSPGVYVIEAPMGMGKTEAALGAAYQLMVAGKANGIYFALPTQATSNRMHLRMNDFLRQIVPDAPGSRLIHGNSWLVATDAGISPAATDNKVAATDDARVGIDWFASTKRALLASFGVGTVDQALLGVVACKHFFVRHFALAGKVVILDEVHSYDFYTGTLIDKLITTLEGLGCTVIILSATLTSKRRNKITTPTDESLDNTTLSYPLITGRSEGVNFPPVAAMPPETKNINVEFTSVANASEIAIALARKGGAVLWVCNTVDAAQEQYRKLSDLANNHYPVGLLHSRFPFWRREKLETEWMERFGKSGETRCGSILVSTQVVEQSVDLDADLLITELAPTDMLLQRLGRLWRHQREHRPINAARIYILEENNNLNEFKEMDAKNIAAALGSKAKIYAPFVLLRSLEVWFARRQVSIPSQIRELIESTYKDRGDNEPESWTALQNEWFGTDSAKKMHATRNCNLWQVALEDEEGVQTRLNELPTMSLVLCRTIVEREATFIDGTKCLLGDDKQHFRTAQAIHKNLVKVPQYCFHRIEPCAEFSNYLYGAQSVGIVSDDGAIHVDSIKNGIQLTYSDKLGLKIEKLNV
jgi:CRISPR-associated endonuclease/helicase Cas3